MAYNANIPDTAYRSFASAGPQFRSNLSSWMQHQEDERLRQQLLEALKNNPNAVQASLNAGTGEQFPIGSPLAGAGPAGANANPIYGGPDLDYDSLLDKASGKSSLGKAWLKAKLGSL
jgi:hypothetical protein